MYAKTRDDSIGRHAVFADHVVDELWPLVLDRITDGLLLANGEGVIVYVNQPLADLFGYEVSDLVGHTIEMLLPEAQREEHQTQVEQYMESPNPRPMGRDDLDIEGRRSDGTHFSVDIQLEVVPGSSLVVATVRDMTVQRQAAVDNAIARIDLANASARIEHLEESLDLVIQRLFALGTSIEAGASNRSILLDRLASATRGIDEVIAVVQQHRHGSGS
jgi:PAS domain S-box-containing protein